MDGAAAPSPRRRLPTKTSSGRISLTPPTPSNNSSSSATSSPGLPVANGDDANTKEAEATQQHALPPTPVPDPPASGHCRAGEAECASCSTNSSLQAHTQHADEIEEALARARDTPMTPLDEAVARSGMAATSSQPAAALSRVAAAAAAAAAAADAATRTPRPRMVMTEANAVAPGSLNSSSAPNVVALPVRRRGSYQSLKRHSGNAPAGPSREGEEPSSASVLTKTTHWERFGTILVLGCLYGDSEAAVMQMLHAEGYDTQVAADQAKAIEMFNDLEVFPDIVLVDCDLPAFSTLQLITQFQALNPTCAIMCLGSRGSTDAVAALQAGAADYMYRPVDLSELIARIERHVQRQHCVKLQLESVMQDTRSMMAQLSSAMALGNSLISKGSSSSIMKPGTSRLIAVAETDFEQQITELSDENQRLGSKLCELEDRLERKMHENGEMAAKLSELEVQITAASSGMQGQLCMVAQQNSALIEKVDALERIVRRSHDSGRPGE